MSYVAGDDRSQLCLLPRSVEDYVDDDAPARVIDAFVDNLDFVALKFLHAQPGSFGRPSYDPRDLLRLYIYGYFNEVRSSRRLERECKRNLEVIWLMRRLAPDHKTIADFRRNNGEAIVSTCRTFVLFCRDQGLFTANLLAIDGSKFRAVASPRRTYDQSRIAETVEELDTRIANYLAELDKADTNEVVAADNTTAKALAALKTRRAELNELAGHLKNSDRRLIVEGECEARPMGSGPGQKPPSYNVQIAVDADTGFVIDHDVTDEANDLRALHPMALAAKTLLGKESLTVIADTGYSNGAAAAACEADGITACVPVKRTVNRHGDGTFFDRTAFIYEADKDRYICPAGRVLARRGVTSLGVAYLAKDCSDCALKPQCTQSKRRSVSRHLHEEALERMDARVAADPDLMRKRRCSAEHPFGTIKRMMSGRFLTRGLQGTHTEMALSVLAYNLLRSIKIQTCSG